MSALTDLHSHFLRTVAEQERLKLEAFEAWRAEIYRRVIDEGASVPTVVAEINAATPPGGRPTAESTVYRWVADERKAREQ